MCPRPVDVLTCGFAAVGYPGVVYGRHGGWGLGGREGGVGGHVWVWDGGSRGCRGECVGWGLENFEDCDGGIAEGRLSVQVIQRGMKR